MIEENDAFKVFEINMERTNLLIQAIDKIGGYNYLYQDKAYNVGPNFGDTVKSIQDIELWKISKSCSEHAIISISTTFETYLKELVQELLLKHGNYFLNQDSIWKGRIKALLEDSKALDFEVILDRLKLKNRFQILDFFKTHKIDLLTHDQEIFIKAIYIKRNNFVHNGSRFSPKSIGQIQKLNKIDKHKYLELSIKKTRTKFKQMMVNVHENVLQALNK